MRRLLTSKWFLIAVIAVFLLALILLGSIPNSPIYKLLTPAKAILNPIQSGIKTVGMKLDDYWGAITDGVAIREENVYLKEEIARLEYEVNKNQEARIRYEELKDAFHIKDTFSNYDVFGASVLSREADEWFSVIRVNAGISDGLELNGKNSFAVVDNRTNLIGRVIETNDSDSKIIPLLHEGFKIVGKVNEVNGITIVIQGDASLKASGLCLVTGIDENVILEVGDDIVTSGDGGLFPQGVPIGEIVSVDYSNPLNITATLRPYASIEDLKDVFIMVPLDNDNSLDVDDLNNINEVIDEQN